MAQNLTGYPSVDKPWLKYYSAEDVKWKVSPCTIYDFIWERNKTYLHETAMMYMGKKYTYGDIMTLNLFTMGECGNEQGKNKVCTITNRFYACW